MKIGAFQTDAGVRYGLILGDRWLDVQSAAPALGERPAPPRLIDFAAGGDASIEWGNRLQRAATLDPDRFAGAWHPLRGARFVQPFHPGGRLFVQRGNSCLFSRVVKLVQPEHPVWERRYTTNLIGHNQVCDYVGAGGNPEFVAIIGAGGRDIPRERVTDHIFGYTMMIDHAGLARPIFFEDWGLAEHENDLVFRDHMFFGAWFGNSLPSNPVGPWIVTRDEIPDPYSLWISAEEYYGDHIRLVEMVSSGASIFRFEDTFAFMSRIMTLKPGDMLSTSSIGNDGYQFWDEKPAGSWLQTTCEKIGSLRMHFSAPETGPAKE